MTEPTVCSFVYGSYMNRDVLHDMHVKPTHVEPARLYGFDIRIAPHASLVVSERDLVYGVLITTTHRDLQRLYGNTEAHLGTAYHPRAVLAQTMAGGWIPAICYISPAMRPSAPSAEYVANIVHAAQQHQFPPWYIARIRSITSDG
jgi:AIG2-like family